ncbi:hypothetical protein Tco_1523901 [Tanacetum coccineum]
MKELQSRLSDVLHDGNKSVIVLVGMCIALEKRLSSALKEKELAKKEKLEKETLAREALAYKESKMEKLIEESNILKQEAMSNSKIPGTWKQFLIKGAIGMQMEYVLDVEGMDSKSLCIIARSLCGIYAAKMKIIEESVPDEDDDLIEAKLNDGVKTSALLESQQQYKSVIHSIQEKVKSSHQCFKVVN